MILLFAANLYYLYLLSAPVHPLALVLALETSSNIENHKMLLLKGIGYLSQDFTSFPVFRVDAMLK